MAYLVATCPNIDLGTAAVILPWHDPLRVAERAIVVDLLSKGRLRLGMGRGVDYPLRPNSLLSHQTGRCKPCRTWWNSGCSVLSSILCSIRATTLGTISSSDRRAACHASP